MREGQYTPMQEDMLAAIRAAGEISRGDLAKRLEKPRLNLWDDKLIKELIEAGKIEAYQKPYPGGIGYKVVFRALDGR